VNRKESKDKMRREPEGRIKFVRKNRARDKCGGNKRHGTMWREQTTENNVEGTIWREQTFKELIYREQK
jgi:hypothetical protein